MRRLRLKSILSIKYIFSICLITVIASTNVSAFGHSKKDRLLTSGFSKTKKGTTTILPTLQRPVLITPNNLNKRILPLSLDPIRFTMKANKDTIAVGEEIELTITAELLDIPPSAFFIFEEQKSFSLKLLLPENFVQTGGNYADYVGGTLNHPKQKAEYTLKGYFKNQDKYFIIQLLRGPKNGTSISTFENKNAIKIFTKLNSAARIAIPDPCDPNNQTTNAIISSPSGKSSICETGTNSTLMLSQAGCYSNIIWYQRLSVTTGLSELKVQDSGKTYTAQSAGVYFVKCNNECGTPLQSNDFAIGIDSPVSAGNASLGQSNGCGNSYKIELIANNAPNHYRWQGQGLLTIDNKVFANIEGYYKIIAENGACISESNTVYVSVPSSINIDVTETSTSCGKNNGKITVSGADMYSISPSNNWTTNNTFENLSAGTYTVYGQTGSCSSNKTVTIGTSTLPNVNITGNITICAGEKSTLNLVGCNGTIEWSTDETFSSITVSPNTTTTYNVTCTEGQCSQQKEITVEVGQKPPKPVITSSGSTNLCSGQSVDLNAPIAYSYKWNNGAITKGITVNSTGNYSVQVKHDNLCWSDFSDEVIVNNLIILPPTLDNKTINSGSFTTLTGSCGNGETLVWEGLPNNIVSPSITTDYTAHCTKNNCRSTSSTVRVTVNPCNVSTPIIQGNTTICAGNSANLSVNNCSGTVKWYLVGASEPTATGPTFSPYPSQTTTYNVTCTIGACTSQPDAIEVTVNPRPSAPTLEPAKTINLRQSTNLSGSCTSGTLIWNGLSGTSPLVTPLVTTTYTAYCSINNTCNSTTSDITVTVIQCPSPPTSSAGLNQTTCGQNPITLGASGSGPGSWSDGNGNFSNTSSPTSTYIPAASEVGKTVKLTWTVFGSSPCANAESSMTVTVVAPSAAANAGLDKTTCGLTPVTLSATGIGSWSGGGGSFSDKNNANATYTPVVSEIGTKVPLKWTVSGTSPCPDATDIMELTVLPTPDAGTIIGPLSVCANSTTQLSTNGLSGGTWSSNSPTIASVSTTGVATGVAAGTALIKYSVSANGCNSETSATVTVKPLPWIFIGAVTCNPSSQTTTYSFPLDANLNANLSILSGSGTLNGNGTVCYGGDVMCYSISNIPCTDVTIQANGNNGCLTTTTVSAKAVCPSCLSCTNPLMTKPSDQTICQGSAFTDLSTSVTNGVTVTYQWYNDNGTANPTITAISGQTTATLTALPTTAGVYKYRVEATNTADASCKTSKTVTLTINLKPTATAAATDPTCITGTSTVNSNGKITIAGFGVTDKYDYTTGATYSGSATYASGSTTIPTGGVIVSNLANPSGATQQYTVRIFNADGCSIDRTVTINKVTCACTNPVLTDLTSQAICEGTTFTTTNLTTDVTNGVTVTYQWYNDNGTANPTTTLISGQTTAVLTALPTAVGVYKYRVEAINTADASCKANKLVTLTINAKPTATTAATDPTCVSGSSTVNSDGKITISGFGVTDKYTYGTGATYTGSANYASGTTTIPAGGIIVSNIANPSGASQQYTVRIFNSAGCFIDRTVIINKVSCNCTNPVLADLTSQSICVGGGFSSTNVTTSVSNAVNVTYQWYNDNGTANPTTTAISNLTTATLTSLPTAAGVYKYRVEAINTADASCKANKLVTLTINAKPTATAAATDPTCVSGSSIVNSDGKITLTGFGVTDKYAYTTGATYTGSATYATGSTTIPGGGVIVNNLANPSGASQQYTVRIFNSAGCFIDRTVIINKVNCNCTNPVLTNLTDQSICVGGGFSSTNVTTSVSNAVNVTYQWYNDNGTANPTTTAISNLTTATLTSLPTAAGVYKYRVEATNTADPTCKASESVTLTITANPTPTVNIPTICSGQTATLTVSNCSGTVTWTGGLTGNPATTPALTASTTYTSTCTVGTCTGTAVATVTVSPNPTATAAATDPTCISGSSTVNIDGKITLTGFDPTDKYDYTTGATYTGSATYATGSTTIPGGGVIVNNLANSSGASQQYTVRIFNSAGCFIDRTVIINKVNCNCTNPVLTNLTDQSICVGGSFTSSNVTTSVSNAVNVTYQWYNDNDNGTVNPTNTAISGQQSATLTALPTAAGVYKYRVEATNTADNTCKSSKSVTLTITALPTATATATPATCNAAGTAANNDAKITLTGFETGNRYALNTSAATYATAQSIPSDGIIGGLTNPNANTTYFIRIFNAAGCFKDIQTTLTPTTCTPTCNATAPSSTIGNVTICAGTSATLSTSGCATTYSLKWFNDATLTQEITPGINGNNLNTPILTTTTDYYAACVKATDISCKSAGFKMTVNVNSQPAAPIPTSSNTLSYCAGSTIPSLTVTVGASQTVDWYNSGSGGTKLATGTLSYTPTSAGTYFAETRSTTVTGCISSSRTMMILNIISPNAPTISATSTLICSGNSSILSSPGCSSGALKWQPTGGLVSGNNYTVTPTATTTYTAQCQEGTCLSPLSNSIKITVNTTQTPVADSVSRCGQGTLTLLASGCSSGYQWYADLTSSTVLGTAASYTTPVLTQTNTYYVLCSGTAACTNVRKAVKAIISSAPNPPLISGVSPRTLCPDSTAAITATGCPSTVAWSYTLSTGGAGTLAATTPTVTIPYNTLTADTTTYQAICIGTCLNSAFSNAVKIVKSANCNTQAGALSGSTSVCNTTNATALSLSGHTGNVLKWQSSLSATFTNPIDIQNTTTSYTANNVTQTTYYRAVVQAPNKPIGYSTSASISVTSSVSNPVSLGDKTTCNLSDIPALSVTVGSGETANWYSSATGGTIVGTGTSFTPMTPGTYYVEAINATSQCKSLTRTALKVGSLYDVVDIKPPVCNGATYSFGITVPAGTSLVYNYGGLTGSSPNYTITNVASGNTVIVRATLNGCEVIKTVTFNCNCTSPPADPVKESDQIICQGQPLPTLKVTVPTGIQVNWYSSVGNLLVTNSNQYSPGAGTYYAQAFNPSTGCFSIARTPVTLLINPQPTMTTTTPVCNGSSYGFDVTVSSGAEVKTDKGSVVKISPTLFRVSGVASGSATTIRTIQKNCEVKKTIQYTCGCTPPAAPTSGGNQAICQGQAIPVLTASVPAGHRVDWYNEQDSLLVRNSSVLATTKAGTYYAQAVNTTSLCMSIERRPVSLTIKANPELNIGTVSCGGNPSYFSVPINVSNRSSVVMNAGGLTGSEPNYTVYNVPTGTTVQIAATLDGCTVTKGVTYSCNCTSPPPAPVSEGNKTICQGEPIPTLKVTVPAGHIVRWFNSLAGGLLYEGLQYSPTAAGTFYAETIQTSTGCRGTFRTPVTLTINPQPTIATTTPVCNGNNYEFNVTTPNWATLKASKGTISGVAPNFKVTGVPSGSSVLLTVSLNDCNISKVITYTCGCATLPAAPTSGGNQTVCQEKNLPLLTATVPAGHRIDWYNERDSLLASNTSTLYASKSGIYYAQAINTTSLCTSIERTPVTLTIKPNPVFELGAVSCNGSTFAVPVNVSNRTSLVITAGGLMGSEPNYTVYNVPSGNTVLIAATLDGCLVTKAVTYNCNCSSPPAAPVSEGDKIICQGDPMPTLKMSVPAGIQVNWFIDTQGNALSNNTQYTPQQAGLYYAQAYNPTTGCYSTFRTPVKITTKPKSTLTYSPLVCNGNTSEFNVTTLNGVVLTSSKGIVSGTAPNFRVTGVPSGSSFTLTATLGDCATTQNLTAPVCTCSPPTITDHFVNGVRTTQPTPQTYCVGPANVRFSAWATAGSATPTFQWKRNGQKLTGQTTNQIYLTVLTVADSGTYVCVAKNACGDSVTSLPFRLNVNPNLTISQHPKSQTVCVAANTTTNVTIRANASGKNVQYQWYRFVPGNSTAQPLTLSADKTKDSVFTVALSSANNGYQYQVLINSDCGNAYSNVATMTVNTAPALSITGNAEISCGNSSALLKAQLSTPLPTGVVANYAWRSSSANTPLSTTDTLRTTTPDTYNLTLSYGNCNLLATQSVTNNAAADPTITLSSSTQIGCSGSLAIAPTISNATTTTIYEWSGPNGFTANTANINVTQGGAYTLVVKKNATTPCSTKEVFVGEKPVTPQEPLLTATRLSIDPENSTTLVARGCSAVVNWSYVSNDLPQGQAAPLPNEPTPAPIIAAPITIDPGTNSSPILTLTYQNTPFQTSATYTAACVGQCGLSTASLPITIFKNICGIKVQADKNAVSANTPVTLIAFLCEAANITWSTGQTGTKTITVTPSATTTYFAVCKLPSTGASCSSSVEVSVSAADCPSNFAITASTTNIQKGDIVTLTANGCTGSLSWSNGVNNLATASLKVMPETTTDYYAICTNSNGNSCFSNSIKVTVNSLSSANCNIYINVLTKTNYTFKKDRWNLRIFFGGCPNGQVLFSKEGTSSEPEGNNGGWYIGEILGDITVKVSCVIEGNTVCEKSLLIPEPTESCFGNALYFKDGSLYNPNEANTFILFDENGKKINQVAASSVKIPISIVDKIYTAKFTNNCPDLSTRVLPSSFMNQIVWYEGNSPSVIYSDTREVGQYSYDFNSNYLLRMAMNPNSSCKGQVVWSNNQDPTFHFTGPELFFQNSNAYVVTSNGTNIEPPFLPFPRTTTTYYATCYYNGTAFPASNSKTLVVNSFGECIRITPKVWQIAQGNSIEWAASGCLGQVTWSINGTNIGTGNTIVHTPIVPTTPTDVVYTATCTNPACSQTGKIRVQPCQVTITASKNLVKLAEPVSLTSSGCSGGQIVWSTGEIARSIVVKPLATTSYTAQCKVDNQLLCASNNLTVTIEAQPPVDIQCSTDFSLSAPTNFVKCTTSPVTITPIGCPTGSTILWQNSVTQPYNEPYKFTPQSTTTITAVCVSPYGTQFNATASIEIVATNTLSVSSTDVAAGIPTIVSATGCATNSCQEGTYRWKNAKGEVVFVGSNYKVTLLEPTTYTITCDQGGSVSVTLNPKKEGDCAIVPTILGINDAYNGYLMLSAKNCDASKPIYWYKKTTKYQYPPTNPPQWQLAYTNVKKITEAEPGLDQLFIYAVVCTSNNKLCYTEKAYWQYLDGTKSYKTGSINISITVGGGDPTTPDPCSAIPAGEKGKRIDYTGIQASTFRLLTNWCPGTQVEWFLDGTKIATLPVPDGYVDVPYDGSTYTYVCKLSNGPLCEGEYELPTPPAKAPDGGRIAANLSSPALVDCPSTLPLSTPLAVELASLICAHVELLKNPDGSMSSVKVAAFLTTLKASVSSRYAASGITVSFPADDAAVIAAIMAQNCTQAGQLLAAPNTAPITPTQFNTVKNATHPLILQDLAPKCDTRIPPDEEMPKALINGRTAAWNLDPNRLYIAPNGRPVKLPIGAYPKFFSFDGVRWGIPPAGTLQGFFYNNQTYFADIESGTQQFNGYRTFAGSCDKPDPNLFYVAPTGTLQNVYYFERYFSSATNTACGYRFIESTYTFNLSQGPNSSVALPLLTGPSNNELILQNCGSSYISKGQLQIYNNATITDTEKLQLQNLLGAVNGKYGFNGSLSYIDEKDFDNTKIQQEANAKGVKEFVPPSGRIKLGPKYLLLFYGSGTVSDCELALINQNMTKLRNSSIYKYTFTDGAATWLTSFFTKDETEQNTLKTTILGGSTSPGLTLARSPFGQALITTGAYFYFAAFAKLGCSLGEEAYYTQSGTNPDGLPAYILKSGATCGRAFGGGAVMSIVEDLDVISMVVGVSEMVEQAAQNTGNTWLNYPTDLKTFMDKLGNDPDPSTLTKDDIVLILPPPIKTNIAAAEQITNVAKFMYQYYGSDANCWRSGNLTGTVLPAIATAGVVLIPRVTTMLTKTVGRVGRLVRDVTVSNLSPKIVNGLSEFYEIATTTGNKIKQNILRTGPTNNTIENIYEEVEENGQKVFRKICGSCLAQNTAVFGTNATLENLQPLTTVQTLEKDGSIGSRNVWGKTSKKVAEVTKIWLKGEVFSSTTDHEFISKTGKIAAAAIRKGTLLFSLALQSFVPVDSAFVVQEPTQVEGLLLEGIEAYGVGVLGIATAPSNGWCVKGLNLVDHKKFNDWITKNLATLKYGSKTGDEAAELLAQELSQNIDKKVIILTEEGVNSRLLVQAERGTQTNRVYAIEPAKNGEMAINLYEPAYKPTANVDIDVDISTKSYIAPDYTTKGGKYLYPQNALQPGQSKTIRIEMKGDVTLDFKEANIQSGFSSFGDKAPSLNNTQYTWHHLDDFVYDPVTGKSYCTMQLVEQAAHTKVVGMGHSGGASQYRKFHGTGY